MKKRAIRNQMVEHSSRLCDTSIRQVGNLNEGFAQIYHYHNTLEVIAIKQGWLEGVFGGVIGKMTKGMMIVFGDDTPHCVLRASDNCKIILVFIPSDLLKWDKERFPELSHGIDYIRGCKSGMVYNDAHLTNEVIKLAGKIESAEGFLRISFIMRLLHILSTAPPISTLLTEYNYTNIKKKEETSIDRAYRYLYKHFREKFSLSNIAAYAGLNNTALCRSFKKSTGCTVWQFCSRLRIEYACNLLLTTNMDISSIAYQSGYNSYPHFCTQFKNIMRVSPTEYRRKGCFQIVGE